MTLVFDSRRFQQFYQYAPVFAFVLSVMMIIVIGHVAPIAQPEMIA